MTPRINIKQMRENAAISNSDLSMALDEIERLQGFFDKKGIACPQCNSEIYFVKDEHLDLCKEKADANKEIVRLRRIIAKELTENDELGSEFVYVMEMKNQLREAKQEIDRIKKLNAIPLTQDVIFQNKLSAAEQERDRLADEVERLKAPRKNVVTELIAAGFLPKSTEKQLLEMRDVADEVITILTEKLQASAAREKVLVEALEEIAFMGMDCAPGDDEISFYNLQLRRCINVAARARAALAEKGEK